MTFEQWAALGLDEIDFRYWNHGWRYNLRLHPIDRSDDSIVRILTFRGDDPENAHSGVLFSLVGPREEMELLLITLRLLAGNP